MAEKISTFDAPVASAARGQGTFAFGRTGRAGNAKEAEGLQLLGDRSSKWTRAVDPIPSRAVTGLSSPPPQPLEHLMDQVNASFVQKIRPSPPPLQGSGARRVSRTLVIYCTPEDF